VEGCFEQIERRLDKLLRRQWWTLGAIAASILATVLTRLL
jgi:uncharacterized protein involved in exopolysaccharide biosynthesis